MVLQMFSLPSLANLHTETDPFNEEPEQQREINKKPSVLTWVCVCGGWGVG